MNPAVGVPSITPRVTLITGGGAVIRKPAFLCVLGPASADLVPDILALEEAAATTDRPPRRGRHIVRALAQLIATADRDVPADIAFAAPDSVGIAIYLSGAVFGESDGRRLRPMPDEPFDRAIPWPYEGLGLYLSEAVPAEPGEEAYDLVEGYVPAAGALLHTPLGLRGTEVHAVATEEPSAAELRTEEPGAVEPVANAGTADSSAPQARTPDVVEPPAPEPVPAEGATPEPQTPDPVMVDSDPELAGPAPDAVTEAIRPPAPPQPSFVAAPLAGVDFQVSSLQDEIPDHREPLAVQKSKRPATEVVEIVESRAHVHGIRCSRGHLNHPRSWLCGVCGIRMDQLTGILVEGERPPLGWLLLDNGSTYLLDEDLVIGREPGRVGRAGAKPIRVPDESGQLSRRHIEIRLVEWDVHLVDLGSANGTYVSDPSMGGRELRLPPRTPHVLTPGSHVRIGGRHFIFESPHARI